MRKVELLGRDDGAGLRWEEGLGVVGENDKYAAGFGCGGMGIGGLLLRWGR